MTSLHKTYINKQIDLLHLYDAPVTNKGCILASDYYSELFRKDSYSADSNYERIMNIYYTLYENEYSEENFNRFCDLFLELLNNAENKGFSLSKQEIKRDRQKKNKKQRFRQRRKQYNKKFSNINTSVDVDDNKVDIDNNKNNSESNTVSDEWES